MRACRDAPFCSFVTSDPGAMVRHRRSFHSDALRTARPEHSTRESLALDEAIAALTNLVTNFSAEAGPSNVGSVSSSTAMAVDEVSQNMPLNQPQASTVSTAPPPFEFGGMDSAMEQ